MGGGLPRPPPHNWSRSNGGQRAEENFYGGNWPKAPEIIFDLPKARSKITYSIQSLKGGGGVGGGDGGLEPPPPFWC